MYFQVFKYFTFLSRQLNCRWYRKSVLFVTGDRASKQVSILVPHTDFNVYLEDIAKLEDNIKRRRSNLQVQYIIDQWALLQDIKGNKTTLENRRIEIADKIKQLKSTDCTSEIEQYQFQGKLLRNELKNLMRTLWALEEKTILSVLNIPNDLHPDTPIDKEVTTYEVGERLLSCDKCHVKIAQDSGLLDYRSPACYYLMGDAAVFEIVLMNYFSNVLKQSEFIYFSNSDFVRSVVLEGCGIQFDDGISTFTLGDTDGSDGGNLHHLIGAASLPSFSSFFAKHIVSAETLPIRCFSTGRQYKPADCTLPKSLFNVWQSPSVEVFIVTKDTHNITTEFHKTLSVIINLYSDFEYHCRIVYLPAFQLNPWESLRASIQMFSPHSHSYVEVGHLSICGTYISKRLLIYCKQEKEDPHFASVISGTVVSIPKFLGCAIEEDYCKSRCLKIPEKLKNCMFSF